MVAFMDIVVIFAAAIFLMMILKINSTIIIKQ